MSSDLKGKDLGGERHPAAGMFCLGGEHPPRWVIARSGAHQKVELSEQWNDSDEGLLKSSLRFKNIASLFWGGDRRRVQVFCQIV